MPKIVPKNTNTHEQHRERLRKRFRAEGGFNNFEEHNVLEMILFYAIPRKDTNEIAHRLLNEFGSFSNVLNAPYESLVKVEGIGEGAATFLKMLPEVCRRYMKGDESEKKKYIKNTQQAIEFVKPYFIGYEEEMVLLICLDGKGEVKRVCEVAKGESTSVSVSLGKILSEFLITNTHGLLLAHNHPHGFAAPSNEDVLLTQQLGDALKTFELAFCDHIIVSKDDSFSFAKSKLNIKCDFAFTYM